jgi:hypothetical protein
VDVAGLTAVILLPTANHLVLHNLAYPGRHL